MRQLIKHAIIMTAVFAITACNGGKNAGTADEDPYLWLEDIEGDRALEWVREQNRISDEAFKSDPLYAELETRFEDVFNDRERIAYPDITGDYVYNLWQDEKNERGLWRRMPLQDYLNGSDTWEIMLDLDRLSAEENRMWVFHGASWLGPENRYCLLTLSDGGKDESVVREFDAVTKSFVEDGFFVGESKGSVAWIDRDNILVATDYGEGTMTSSGYPAIAKRWKRGADPATAETVASTDTTNMGIFLNDSYEAGTQYTFINEMKGFYEKKLSLYTPEGLQFIDIPADAENYGMFGACLLIYLQADWTIDDMTYKRGTVVSFDLKSYLNGTVKVRTVYEPGERSSFESLISTKESVILASLDNVVSKLTRYKFDGESWNGEEIAIPEFGTVSLISSDNMSDRWFFSFSNPVTPSTLYFGDGTDIRAIKKQKDYFNTTDLVVDQNEAVSKDGTVIPYFIVHKKDLAKNGKNPTLIYGYGGFNISELPVYSSVRGIGWMERGGVYVIATIRGGGEFGPAWHKAALKEKRQNAYDDFFAVAEEIIREKISSPEYMGAFGWSNGGLLAGVALTQRPDLYNAVVIGAPLLDMKRYSKMLAGASWMDEYGDPDKPEDWKYISKYSPYQNISSGKKYPEPLFITSTKDDRVHPGHARKMAAKMLEMGHPLYYHETIEGGHGAASTNRQEAEMWALMYTYLNRKLMHD
jgi:prolyl oligopeptidase